MRENRTYGSEGGEPAMDNSPTPITGRYGERPYIAQCRQLQHCSTNQLQYQQTGRRPYHRERQRAESHWDGSSDSLR